MSRLLLLLPLAGCQDYNLDGLKDRTGVDSGTSDSTDVPTDDGEACPTLRADPVPVTPNDACHFEVSSFEPVVAWDVPGRRSNALPVVADIDQDGMPDIVAIWNELLLGPGSIEVLRGDGSGTLWADDTYNLGYGSAPAVADLDGDGSPEIVVPVEYQSSLFGSGDYTLLAYDADGNVVWESEHFVDKEFDYSTGVIVSDMNHDGSPEVIAGNVILHADGTTRTVSPYDSRGCPADAGFLKEGAYPAVADLDLDGQEELITGNTITDIDGRAIWRNAFYSDGAVGVANLDGDPEGEFVVTMYNEVRAHDTNGDLLWGPTDFRTANILASPAIGDIDADGEVEIVTAGGNEIRAMNADGSTLWTARVTDESGATGASIFDFDADGIPEVVYIDEVEMIAFNGSDGAIKFHTNEHSSATMYDYPVIADVDANGHADIVVVHDSWSSGLSVYRDLADSWAPARQLWNQHAYSITNINDDLSVPTTAVPNFTVYNNWHSALALPPGGALAADVTGEILEVCELDCDAGSLRVLVRVNNTGSQVVPAGLPVALYGTSGTGSELLATGATASDLNPELSTGGIELVVDAAALDGVTGLYLVVDDDGTGTGRLAECLEDDNGYLLDGAVCD